MNLHAYEWRAGWEEHGTRIRDDRAVPIRLGVINAEGFLTMAISVACTTPVAITHRTATGIGELMQWAQEEHEMLYEQQQQRRAESAKEAFDLALLTRRQWKSILRAITDADSDHLAEAAAALRAAAPRAWTDGAAEEPHSDVADLDQAIPWLDDIDAQLSDIATQVNELRRHFPAPSDDAGTETLEERGHVSSHAEDR
ncbi:hypothetical protein [Haloechinothrix salitolerans]|uniref:Uncharacterized protein n=1 Tax=Haloechinothrix salitolerans TaxID=926830 RepID=A0ABW2C3W6_9PSEU